MMKRPWPPTAPGRCSPSRGGSGLGSVTAMCMRLQWWTSERRRMPPACSAAVGEQLRGGQDHVTAQVGKVPVIQGLTYPGDAGAACRCGLGIECAFAVEDCRGGRGWVHDQSLGCGRLAS